VARWLLVSAALVVGCDRLPLAEGERLCQPCTSRDDCDPGGLCHRAGDGPLHCGIDCTDKRCPYGYVCAEVYSAAGDFLGNQCATLSGTCPGLDAATE
jgi:hypothetical protein